MRREKKALRERGSSMIEFCFTIPILLLIAGATIDIARYMRYQQIISFVSQETGSEIYQQCSDLTVYQKPNVNSSGLVVDSQRTIAAVALCALRIQNQSQMVLNTSLGRSSISSNVFRYGITLTTPPNCNGITGNNVQKIPIKANMNPTTWLPNLSALEVSQYSFPSYTLNSSTINLSTSNGTSAGGQINLNDVNTDILTTPKLALNQDSLYLTLPSGETRQLVAQNSMCNRGRVVAVEVGYDFDPIVKFLPMIMTKLDSNGNQRAITIF